MFDNQKNNSEFTLSNNESKHNINERFKIFRCETKG